MNGRSWTLRYEALPAFFSGRGDNQPFLVLAGGTIISLLLFGLTWFAVRTRNSALTLAEQMSLASHENERRFTGIFYSAMDAIISVDESQNIVHFNPAAERIFRCDAVQVAGTPLSRFIPQRFRESHAQHVERFGLTGISDRQMGNKSDLIGLRFNGEEFPLEASISQTTQNGRKLFTVMLRDVSARRQAEISLRNSEQRFRGLVEVSPEAILIHQDGKIIFSNKAAMTLFGAAESDHLTGTSIFRFFHSDSLDGVRQTIESIMAGAPSMPIMERKVVRLSGELRYVEVAVSVFEEAGKHIILEMMRDITDRHLDRAALEHSHAELRQLGVALEIAQEGERKRIAQELHDDLGQTLTVLKMDMSSLKSQLMATPADATACATWLEDIDRMDGLLNHTVLSVRQISAGLRPQLLDDLGLATALEALVMQVSRSSHIHCTFDLDPERLLIDQRLATPLYRIAQEALNNIVKHAKATEVSLRLYRDVASCLILEVRDNGIGITGENRRKAASFGLIGMRERVYALNGELLIESQGNGTLIHVAIPSNENGSFSKA
ncbi:MAG: PAS domain S-box protein [Betaproteobacteria bacterium]|nr:PAS domain S-box protein [Betaproteobacteria bacterium]